MQGLATPPTPALDERIVALEAELAAARALLGYTDLPAEQIARAAMEIAAALCIYTNTSIIVDTISASDALPAGAAVVAKGE